jgi:FkbM family methyltransferase
MIEDNLQRNGVQERAVLIPAGAGVTADELFLTDEGPSSTVLQEKRDGAISIKIVDWVDYLPAGKIDLLKIDTEGAEYQLLADPRFAEIAARTEVIVLEWHKRPDLADARQTCIDYLKGVGFKTIEDGTVQMETAGILWAYRN